MIGPPTVPPSNVAMQLRNLVVRRNILILIEEEWSGVEPAGAAVGVKVAVQIIGARRRAHVDVRARRRTLLRVIHRGIHADFLQASREPGSAMALPIER